MGCISSKEKAKNGDKQTLSAQFKPGNYKVITKKYIINPQVLGTGNFGKVFLGTSRENPNHKCAIKLIDKKKGTAEEIELIKSEIMILSKLDHSNIAKYYETYESPKNIYLVMEYCGGVDLFDKIVSCKETLTEKTTS